MDITKINYYEIYKITYIDYVVKYDDMVDGEWYPVFEFLTFCDSRRANLSIYLRINDDKKIPFADGDVMVNGDYLKQVKTLAMDMECMRSKFNHEVEKLDKMYKMFLLKSGLHVPLFCPEDIFSNFERRNIWR